MGNDIPEALSKEQVAEMMADKTGLYSWEHIQRLCRSHEYLRARLEMKQHEINRLVHRASAQIAQASAPPVLTQKLQGPR